MGKSLADPLERLVCSPRGCLTHISDLLYIAWMRYRRSIAVASHFALPGRNRITNGRRPQNGWRGRALAVAVYLAAGAAVSYLVWGPWEGVDPWPFSFWVLGLLFVFHLFVGAAIGRWWAVLLPLAWALISFGAEGYDTPVAIVLLFQTPFLWAPALFVGVAGRKLAAAVRSTTAS
jgi:hypothetical protein